MSLLHLSDKALAKRMLGGDERAFREFFDEYFPGLYRFALSRVGRDPELAEEVAQSTIVKAIDKLATYRGEAALFNRLCTFCRHEIHAYLKKLRRVPDPVGLIEDLPEIRAALDSLSMTGDDGPDEALRRKETVRWVQITLDHLPRHYGQVLEWKYMHELPVKEIARRLELGPKAAESLLTRARGAFRDSFASAPHLLRRQGAGVLNR